MLQQTRRIAIAMLAVAAALGTAACGESTIYDPPQSPSKTTAAQTEYPPIPSAADLNADLQKVLDPTVPNDQKLDLMQGVSADPNLPQRLTDFYTQNNATATVLDVVDLGNGTLTADVQAAINGGQPQQAVVPFVAENGRWKVQKEWICNTLAVGNQSSPACQ